MLRNYSDCLCILCVVFLFFWVPQIFPLNICFSSPSALFICLSRGLFYPAISITSSFDFFSVHDIFLILLMYTFLLLQVFSLGPMSMSSIHIHKKEWTIIIFHEYQSFILNEIPQKMTSLKQNFMPFPPLIQPW